MTRCTEDILSSLSGRVTVVGNGTPAWALGHAVDRSDVVIRFNNFRIRGYERLVGQKTTFRCTTGWRDIELRGEHPEFSPFTADALHSGNVARYNRMAAVPLILARTDVREFFPEFEHLSTGLALVQLCVMAGLRVNVVAFDGFATPHYWESEWRIAVPHSRRERDILLRLPGVLVYDAILPDRETDKNWGSERSFAWPDHVVESLVGSVLGRPRWRRLLCVGSPDHAICEALVEAGCSLTEIGLADANTAGLRPDHGQALGPCLAELPSPFDAVLVLDFVPRSENDVRLTLREAAYRSRHGLLYVPARNPDMTGLSMAAVQEEIETEGLRVSAVIPLGDGITAFLADRTC